MEQLTSFVDTLCGYLWNWPMMILLIGTHLFLTIRLRFPQRHIFKAIKLSFARDENSPGDITPFGALVTSLAATVGTGNIIGVATAIALGGPGAVLWCWLTGVFGISTKYAEGLLAIKYRVKNSQGEISGGPMYALSRGLNMKWLAVLFSIFTAIASFGIGNMVPTNAIASLIEQNFQISPLITGVVVAIVVALPLLAGVKGITRFCAGLIPFMAIFYVLGCLTILIINRAVLGDAIELIVRSAFSPQAAGGGFIGSTVMMAARFGIARGLYSNESGMGSAPIIAAAAQTRNPVRQALVSSTATFWDTVVICALTGLVIVSSVLAYPHIDQSQGALLTYAAFGEIPYIGSTILFVGVITFCLSTVLGWSYYGLKAIEFLGGVRTTGVYKILWIVAIVLGAVLNLELVWSLADASNALMAIPNLIAVLLLSGIVVKETRKYLWSGKIDEYDNEEIPTSKK